LAGFSGFLRRLRAEWRRVLLRFTLGLAGASLAWLALAPVYAGGLAAVARAAVPVLENTPGAYYTVEGSRVLVYRPVRLPGQTQMRDVVYTVWLASGAFGLPVLAALILATPGWSGGTRARALAWGLGLLTITQIASMLVSVDFWQQMPVTLLQGPAFYLSGHSARRLQVISAVYYFFEIMGRGFFVLVVYVALVGFCETRLPAGRGAERNAKCPCGSGRKFKHCCGAAA
jgi:SEC-C motif